MKGLYGKHRWLIVIVGLLVLAVAFGGTAIAGKKKSKDNGWLGVFIHEVDEDTQEAGDLETDGGIIIDDVIDDSPAEMHRPDRMTRLPLGVLASVDQQELGAGIEVGLHVLDGRFTDA